MADEHIFGSPDRNDATARFEILVNTAAERMKSLSRGVAPNVLNRMPGTTLIPPDAQQREFEAMMALPDEQFAKAVTAQRELFEQVFGPSRGHAELKKLWNKRSAAMKGKSNGHS